VHVIAAWVFLAATLHATDYTIAPWYNTNWIGVSAWTPEGYPNTASDRAYIASVTNANRTIYLNNQEVTCQVIYVTATNGPLSIGANGATVAYCAIADGGAIVNNGSFGGGFSLNASARVRPLGVMAFTNEPPTQTYMSISSDFLGSGTVYLVRGGNMGSLNIFRMFGSCDSPDFTGTIVVDYNSKLQIYNSPGTTLTNPATTIIVKTGGVLTLGNTANSATSRLRTHVIAEEGATLDNVTGVYQHIEVRGVCVTNTCWGATNFMAFVENLSGTGSVHMLRQSGVGMPTNAVIGVLAPGLPVGVLEIYKVGTVSCQPMFGLPDDRMELQIDVSSDGGIAGLDYDLLISSNGAAATDLALIDLTIVNAQAGQQTNWFWQVQNGWVNTFNSMNISGDSFIVYDEAARRIGVVVVPEPVGGISLFTLAVCVWRRPRVHQCAHRAHVGKCV
jgi:hypothetical protein